MTTDRGDGDGALPRGWQDRLCRRHESWLSRPWPSFSVDDGWSGIVEELFDGIGDLLRRADPQGEITVFDVKEKHGGLRVSWSGAVDAALEDGIERLIADAETRCDRACDQCGARGSLRSTRPREGWLAVKCDDHAARFPYRAGGEDGET